jgi:hypothetical protein
MGFLKKMLKPKMPTIVMPSQDPAAIPVAPEVTPAPVMPDADATEVNRAKTQEIRRRMQRGGRASTIMSQSSGGDDFGSSRLG